MKTSWRSASLVATAAAVLVLTTACGQEQGSTSSQNVGAASSPTLGAGTIAGTETFPATMTLDVPGLKLHVTFSEDVKLE